MKMQVRHAARQVRPITSDSIVVARGWAAPRLHDAAQTFEDRLAPRVSSILTQAAERISPTPVRPTRRWPVMAIALGLALSAAGFALYRRNAQQWAETMKDTAEDASQWMSEKAEKAKHKAQEIGGEASRKADEASRKMS
ncbi:hypothetical protein [Sinosporangium album]|nr:hypothetical protein [Sinosporangium album]